MKVETVPITSIQQDPENARKHSLRNLEAIAGSLAAFGQRRPLVVWDGYVIAGNGTLEAAKSLGWTQIDITRVPPDWTHEQARAYALADNRTAELAEWDSEILANQLVELDSVGYEISDWGFEPLTPPTDPDEGPEILPDPPSDPVTKLGDIWICGNHRIMCGSATDPHAVKRLFNGNTADMLFTSPPYALGGSMRLSGNNVMSKKENAYDQHEDSASDWPTLMNEWWLASQEFITDIYLVNVQMLAGNKRPLISWINERSDHLIDVITWDKGHAQPPMASSVLTSQFEWIIAFGKKNASRAFPLSTWRGTVSNLYQGPPQRSNEYADKHAATMPLHLPIWAMSKLCNLTQTVYDPFMGTGTTLIAADELGITSYGMEISPAYCDVIINRWETKTGATAEKVKE